MINIMIMSYTESVALVELLLFLMYKNINVFFYRYLVHSIVRS